MSDHLLFIEANTTGTGLLALQKALAMNLRPLFFTNNPQRYPGIEQIDCPIIVCDTNTLETLTHTISEHIGVDRLLGVTTTSEFYLETVAELAAMYHLPGNTLTAARACRNKANTRQCLQSAGVRQPRFVPVHASTDMKDALKPLRLPYVVKPAEDTGSQGVLLCPSQDEAIRHARQLYHQQTNVRGQRTNQIALIEEFVDAPEYSVETFTWNGKTTCIGITEKIITGAPYFIESQHIFPAPLSQEIAQDIQSSVFHALNALGFTHGPAHTEIKATTRGTMIIEVNARLAGGMIPELMRCVTGIDILEQQIKSSVGVAPEFRAPTSGYAGIRFLLPHRQGIWQGARSLEKVQELTGIRQVTITTPPGKRVAPPRSAYDRLGFVIASASTYTNVVQILQTAIDHIELCITDEPI